MSLCVAGLGVGCKENGDCKTPNTYCKANRCHCAAGFVFSDDASRCLPGRYTSV